MTVSTVGDILRFVSDNDVKFIRLAFCDLFGTTKNISIMAGELEDAFESGFSFDASAMPGFANVTRSDLLLFPDPKTMRMLPWRPQQGRVIRFMCDIMTPELRPYVFDGRRILKTAVENCDRAGFSCIIGSECEFYLFRTDEKGRPTAEPHDCGTYFDVAPADKCVNIRREICLCLDEMGITPESSHHERGPGQNEIDFHCGDALCAADDFLTYKNVVKVLSDNAGLFASFMPKPLPNESGNGLHINLSLWSNGINRFENAGEIPSGTAASFMAGIMKRINEITVFLNSTVNSYDRLGSFEAPKYVSWSHQNRSQLIRIPAAKGSKSRLELRSPDPAVNPHLAFAFIIEAGLAGIRDCLELSAPVNQNLYCAGSALPASLSELPPNLAEAAKCAKNSDFVNEVAGEELVCKFTDEKENEYQEYLKCETKSDFYLNNYFNIL